MAALTAFSDEALARFLVMFELYDDIRATPIETGIENSNYRVQADGGEYVLTISETLGFDDTAFFNEILTTLARADVPVPTPLRTLDGMSSTIFCGKPTWLFSHLPGQHPVNATGQACTQIGRTLALIHTTLHETRYHRDNPHDHMWAEATLAEASGTLSDQDNDNLTSAISLLGDLDTSDHNLPRGTVHGDLRRDNTLFEEDRLSGVLDFYHACDDYLIMDLAIAMNDWCPGDAGLQEQMMTAYSSIRELTDQEHHWFPAARRVAAMRLALTRWKSGSPGRPLKDPSAFLSLLARLYET